MRALRSQSAGEAEGIFEEFERILAAAAVRQIAQSARDTASAPEDSGMAQGAARLAERLSAFAPHARAAASG